LDAASQVNLLPGAAQTQQKTRVRHVKIPEMTVLAPISSRGAEGLIAG
jgi:hypothetical protein